MEAWKEAGVVQGSVLVSIGNTHHFTRGYLLRPILQYKISLLQPVIAQLPPLSNSDCKLLLSSHLGPLYVCQRTITSLCVNFSGNKKTISPVISVSSVQRCHLPRIQARQTLTLPVIHISYLNGYHQ